MSSDSAKKKRKETFLRKYGVENPSQMQSVKDARKETFLRKYGVENANQVEEFKQKARETNLMKYGVEYPSHTEKGIITNLERYGVRHPMQNMTIFQKVMDARFKIKYYTAPSGRVFSYQGYEDVLLKFLLEEMQLSEDWIINDPRLIPKVIYFNPLTLNDSRYYPDIFVKPLNLLLEVKSTFTFKINTGVTLEKQKQCQRMGFFHLILICSKRKILEML